MMLPLAGPFLDVSVVSSSNGTLMIGLSLAIVGLVVGVLVIRRRRKSG